MTALVATTVVALSSSVALAGWSRPRALSGARSSPYANTAVAVDARGDAAVTWETVGRRPKRSRLPLTTVHVAVLTASGRRVMRTPWSGRINSSMRLSVALGGGEVTVAWGVYNDASTSEVARVAYGPLIGRWSPPRVIGRFWDAAFTTGRAPWYPRLATAPDGEVLAAWNACTSSRTCGPSPRGIVVAWRAPRHGFAAPQVVRGAPLGAVPRFDAGGTGYLDSPCSADVPIAPARSHRFGRSVVVTRGPVSEFTLSLAGPGQGLAAWVVGACSLDEAVPNATGPVLVSALRSGRFAAPLALTPAATDASYSNAVAVPGGGTVSWFTNAGPGGFAAFSAPIGAGGRPGPTQPVNGAIVALSADGGGDVVFARPPGSGPSATAVFVRPAGGGPDQAAPAPSGDIAVAAPVGRAAALVWAGSRTLELSVWRP